MGVCLYSWGWQTHLDVYLLIKQLRKHQTKTHKIAGDMKGFSLNPGAVGKCYLTSDYRSICLQKLKRMVQEKPPDVLHAGLEPARIKKDEACSLLSTYYKRHG